MPLYEHVFLARQDLATAQVDGLADQFTKIVEAGGGKVAKTEYWGLKSIAYRIKKNRKAHYVLLNIDAPAPAIAELERNVGLSEDILRYITIRVDELEAGPSAMMRKQDRDRGDRPERGERMERMDRPERGDRSDKSDRGDRGDRRAARA